MLQTYIQNIVHIITIHQTSSLIINFQSGNFCNVSSKKTVTFVKHFHHAKYANTISINLGKLLKIISLFYKLKMKMQKRFSFKALLYKIHAFNQLNLVACFVIFNSFVQSCMFFKFKLSFSVITKSSFLRYFFYLHTYKQVITEAWQKALTLIACGKGVTGVQPL